jgi:hypothetical protein
MKDRQLNGQKKKRKRQTKINKTLHRKLSIKQQELHYDSGELMFSGRVRSNFRHHIAGTLLS